jgi:hypothetical protein
MSHPFDWYLLDPWWREILLDVEGHCSEMIERLYAASEA